METIVLIFLVFIALAVLAAILNTQSKILKELKNIRIPEPPKIEFPKIEIPPAKEVSLDLNPVVEAVNNIRIPEPQKIEIPPAKEVVVDLGVTAELLQNLVNTQSDLIKILQESTTLMRVNQAEFQSGLEAFHKAIDKLLAQVPSVEKELDAQKELVQKFEEAFVKAQETAAENMNANSLRLQEILTEVLNK
ncbi:MAG: hypothetical protein FWH22_04795 [Fibromonadales bacterium]|nr:hypothetical protein [Fibromonadales bacterium]